MLRGLSRARLLHFGEICWRAVRYTHTAVHASAVATRGAGELWGRRAMTRPMIETSQNRVSTARKTATETKISIGPTKALSSASYPHVPSVSAAPRSAPLRLVCRGRFPRGFREFPSRSIVRCHGIARSGRARALPVRAEAPGVPSKGRRRYPVGAVPHPLRVSQTPKSAPPHPRRRWRRPAQQEQAPGEGDAQGGPGERVFSVRGWAIIIREQARQGR